MNPEENKNYSSNNESNFDLPRDYFHKSAKSIRNKIEWKDEHEAFKTLLSLKDTSGKSSFGFETPENYFKDHRVLIEKTQLAQPVNNMRDSGFLAPENYFANNKFKLLNTLSKKSELDNAIKKTKTPQSTIISLFWKPVSFALAAMLLVIFGIWLFQLNSSTADEIDCKTIACLEKQTVINNLSNFNLENEDLYELVDPVELQQELIGSGGYHFIEDSMTNENLNSETSSDE